MYVAIKFIFVCLYYLVLFHGTISLSTEKAVPKSTRYWCDIILGCLNLTSDWQSEYRPINVLPLSREEINTRFYLHTREEPNVDKDYAVSADDLESIWDSPFDPFKQTKFIVHGFTDSGNTTWLKDLAAALVNYGDYNVFRVDWGRGSRPMYYQATSNTRVVGLEIGHLVNTLSNYYSLAPNLVHCIGHSLGSHVCGYAGEQIKNMGRITGLDPAGPYFTGTASFIHLDPTDATFVDVIHTDGESIFELGFGTAQPMGNIDFYPNSGRNQPGCTPVRVALDVISEDFLDSMREVIACSHLRSIYYFQETLISPKCSWLGHECQDYNSFQKGECYSCTEEDSRCGFLGMKSEDYAAKSREYVQLYLDTDKETLFCMQHYQVSILMAYPPEAESWVMGRIYISLYGDNENIIREKQITENHEHIEHGQLKTSLFLSHQDVGHVIRVELKWVYDDDVLNPGTYCWSLICNKNLYVESIQVSAINHYPEEERLEYTSLTCSLDGSTTKIKDGHTESFMISTNCEPIVDL